MRAARLAAYEALSLPQGRNFVITKKEGGEEEGEDENEVGDFINSLTQTSIHVTWWQQN